MSHLPYIFTGIIYLVAYATAYCMCIFIKQDIPQERVKTIDGMRGFLAFGVFIHHTAIWYQYIQASKWQPPASNLYNHLGLTSVSFFFMITSFLFISRLINHKSPSFHWFAFYKTRILRIAPMYYFSLAIIMAIVGFKSHWQINIPPITLLKSIMDWLLFAIHDSPDINAFANTSIINAGVVWSLSYEWLFYFSLPIIAVLILRTNTINRYLIFGIAFVSIFYFAHGIQFYPIYSFIGGGIAPFLLKHTKLNQKINNKYSSIFILICLLIMVQFHSPNNLYCLVLSTLIFTLIALGSSVFGILNTRAAKLLGDISYSSYLLHGILLFCFFNIIMGMTKSALLTANIYIAYMALLTPILILISYLGFRFIENPFIKK